jgi:isoleucyl-tRNA synthetase
VRWPLAEVVVDTKDETIKDAITSLQEILCKQANVRKVVVKNVKVKHTLRPDIRALGKEFGVQTADVIETINKEQKTVLQAFEDGREQVKIGLFTILSSQVTLIKEVPSEYALTEMKSASVYLLTTMTEELEEEGLAREIIRNIQQQRKNLSLNKTDRVMVRIVTASTTLCKQEKLIGTKVGASSIDISPARGDETFEAEVALHLRNKDFLILLSRR